MPALAQVIEAPPAEKIKFDLLDTFPPKPLPAGGIAAGVTYEAEYCGPAQTWSSACEEPAAAKDSMDSANWVEGAPLTVFQMLDCRLPGTTEEQRRNRSVRALDSGASRVIEPVLGALIGAEAGAGAGLGILTGGDIVTTLAALEQYAGENYGGRAVIHMTRTAATMAFSQNLLFRVDGHLETGLGSIVVAGAGYGGLESPTTPAAGKEWMYATGAVNIYRSEVIVNEYALERGEGGGYTNEYASLSEAIYVPTYECFAAASQLIVSEVI